MIQNDLIPGTEVIVTAEYSEFKGWSGRILRRCEGGIALDRATTSTWYQVIFESKKSRRPSWCRLIRACDLSPRDEVLAVAENKDHAFSWPDHE